MRLSYNYFNIGNNLWQGGCERVHFKAHKNANITDISKDFIFLAL